ncbi:type II secretion system F family protein [Psychromarinibacter sp. S121]|uniref:type II secretion system F family protein n=1 Tax=Psychromarinibacter sp. S121 TaxID=3415127 RepID=UPI003C79CF4B
MQPFAYVAYTAKGQRRTGTLVAESERAAIDALKAQGLMASEIEARAGAKRDGPARRGGKLDADERALFTRQMAVLLAADLPIENALDAVIESDGSKSMQAFAAGLKAATLEGYPLSDAIDSSRAGFAPYYASSLRAGEGSGELAAVFGGLADYLEAQGANRAEIATALVYPGFVAAVSLVVCAILVTTVAPELVGMFEVTGQPLPGITRTVLGVSGWIEAHWLALCLGLIAAVLGVVVTWRTPAGRDRMRRAGLRIPVFGRLKRMTIAAQYLRTMAVVLGSRQTALNAATGAAEVVDVSTHRAEADAVVTAVRQGESLGMALKRFPILPPVALQLIRVGEDSARLAPMAERAAVLVETWLANDRKRLAAILDPVLMMLVGGFVLIVVLAVLLPIFDLQSAVMQ